MCVPFVIWYLYICTLRENTLRAIDEKDISSTFPEASNKLTPPDWESIRDGVKNFLQNSLKSSGDTGNDFLFFNFADYMISWNYFGIAKHFFRKIMIAKRDQLK